MTTFSQWLKRLSGNRSRRTAKRARLCRRSVLVLECLEDRLPLALELLYGGTGTPLSLTEVSAAADNVTISYGSVPGLLRIALIGGTFDAGSTPSAPGLAYGVSGSPGDSTFATINISTPGAISTLSASLGDLNDLLTLGMTNTNGGVGSIALDGQGGVDTFTIADFSLGGTGTAGDLSVAADTINVNGAVKSTGAASGVTLTADRNIVFNSGAGVFNGSITTDDSDITLSANQQATPTSGNFIGIDVNRATIATSGAGDVVLLGRGGNSLGNNYGINLRGGAKVVSTAAGADAGAITIDGTGGAGLSNANYGVWMTRSGTQVTSVDGDIRITGQGGGTGSLNHGVHLTDSAVVSSTGTGADAAAITIDGAGAGGGTSTNLGVWMINAGTQVTSLDGDIQITGQGGDGSGNFKHGVLMSRSAVVSSTGTGANAAAITIGGAGGGGTSTNHGVWIRNSGTQVTSVDGDIEISGHGGAGSGSNNYGVYLLDTAVVSSTGTGADAAAITLNGTGGAGTSSNYGTLIEQSGTQVTSVDGDIQITGHGGGGSGSSHCGMLLSASAVVSSTGTGADAAAITIDGTGGAGTFTNLGVWIRNSGTQVTSVDGDIQITGQGGAGSGATNYGALLSLSAVVSSTGTGADAAAITIDGTGGGGTSTNLGFWIRETSKITSVDGDIQIIGQAGAGSGSTNHGALLSLSAVVSSTGTGPDAAAITIDGAGGGSSTHRGVWVRESGKVTSVDGDIQITGKASPGNSTAIELRDSDEILSTGTANVTLIGDSMNILGANAVDAGTNTVTLSPETIGTAINLGGADAAGTLGLTDAELDRITAGTLIIGDGDSGNITVSADISRLASTEVELRSGNAIIFDPGSFDTAGGTLLLAPGAAGVQPLRSGADAVASTVSFASDLVIDIEGTTVDTEYSQLSVDGAVDLAGVDLVLSGSYTPVNADVFTIVSATGGVAGQFNGLNDGNQVILGGVPLTISYTPTSVALSVNLAATDVSLDSFGNLLIAAASNNNTLSLSLNSAGTHVVIFDPNSELTAGSGATQIDDNTVEILLTDVIGQIIVNAGGGDDTLTVDFSNGNFIPAAGLAYDGGGNVSSNPGDQLIVTGGSFTTVTHSFTNANDGSVELDGSIITYTGLEPVIDNLDAVNRAFVFNGGNETITLSDSGGADGMMTIDSTMGESVTFANPSASLTIEAGTGDDTITVISVDSAFNASLTIDGQGGFDVLTFNAALALDADNSVNFSADTIDLATASVVNVSGAGGVTLTADKNIALSSGSSISATDGDITLTANAAGTATGNFTGIDLNNAQITSSGAGGIKLDGTGGNTSGNKYGARLRNGAVISGGVTRAVEVKGRGGASSSGNGNYGVYVQDAGSQITSSGGAVLVEGNGGGAGTSFANIGVYVGEGGVITSEGTAATVTVQGLGGNTTFSSHGVFVRDSQITSSGGAVLVEGTSGGHGLGVSVSRGVITSAGSGAGATVTVQGFGGNTADDFGNNFGVLLANTQITSSGGAVLVEGYGGGAGTSSGNSGVVLSSGSVITSAAAGAEATVTVKGFGGATGSGARNVGVWVQDSDYFFSPIRSQITSSGGAVLVEGTGGGAGTSSDNYGVMVDGGGVISRTAASVTVQGFGGNTAGSGGNNFGVHVLRSGVITSAAAGAGATVTVHGFGGNTTGSGGDNIGVHVQNAGSQISSSGGDIEVAGAGGSGASSHGILVQDNGQIVGTTGTPTVALTADSIALDSTTSINAGSSTVKLRQRTAGTRVNLGGADILSGSPRTLGLTDAELDRIIAGTIQIGDGDAGAVTITSAISHTGDADIRVESGRNIAFNSGTSWTTADGDLEFVANASGNGTGHFAGIELNAARITSSGAGAVKLDGTGGDTSAGNFGVRLVAGAVITGMTGSVEVRGHGGASSSGGGNYGAAVQSPGSRITSSGGAVLVEGTGGGSGSTTDNYGVFVISGGVISSAARRHGDRSRLRRQHHRQQQPRRLGVRPKLADRLQRRRY